MEPPTTSEVFANWQEAFTNLQQFTLDTLPKLNDSIVANKGCVHQIIQQTTPAINVLVNTWKEVHLNKSLAIEILRYLSPVISSIQRHIVTYHYEQRHFSEFFVSGVEDFLLALAQKTGLPPRDSHYTTWLLNDNPTIRFDNNPGWLFFWSAVRATNDNNLNAFYALDEITKSPAGIHLRKTKEILQYAQSQINNTFLLYQEFVKGGMNTGYFANIFRTYFLEYTILGEKYTGSNATNVASVPALHFKIGVTTPEYDEVVKKRYIHLTPEDIRFVEYARREPSLLQLIIEYLGYDYFDFKYKTSEDLKPRFNKQLLTLYFKEIYSELLRLIRVLSRWSQQHFGLINTYLIKESKKAQSCPLGHISPVVDYTQGVGGASHDETKAIRDMRGNHYLVKKINAIINS